MKTQENKNLNENSVTEISTGFSLEFSDVVVYNEMADKTSVKLNLVEQIQSQLNQLEEMNQRRNFLMKEVLSFIS
jgi:hypothetical protein